MDHTNEQQPEAVKAEPTYEPPRVEQVLTSDDLAREVLYAGGGGSNT